MGAELLKRNLIIWFGLFALGFANGALREVAIKRVIAEPWAHHLSALTAVLIFSGYVQLVWNKTKIITPQEAFWVGTLWLVLTVLTETFVLNRWISKLTWEQILQSYNVARGELWPWVLIWVGVLPWVTRLFRGPAQ